MHLGSFGSGASLFEGEPAGGLISDEGQSIIRAGLSLA